MVQRIEWVGEVRCRHLRPSLDRTDARPWIGYSFSGQRRQEITSFHHIRALILLDQISILDDVAASLFYSLLLE